VQDLGDWCSVIVVEPGGTARRAAVARTGDRLAGDAASAPAGGDDTPGDAVARVLLSGQAELYPELTPAIWAQIAPASGPGATLPSSALVVPLVAHGRTIGALALAGSARRYGPADLALATDLASRTALAVDNARLYTEVQAALAVRDRFLAVAAHELRTPVTRLKIQAELLRRRQQRGQLDAARLEVGLVAIDDAADQFVRLTRDLLDVSRLRSGQLPLRHRPLDLADLVQTVVTREGTRLNLGDRLRVALAGDLPLVAADPDRLEQVLANLLENAAKYSPEGGAIEVTVAVEGGGLLLCVRDSGIGLPPGAAETIFTPFERAENATSRRIPGLGLGLSICRDIAVRHGGRLWAESAGEGQGTTMHLWLPASARQVEIAGAEAAD
jgi:signal transduction histidine kinase